MFPRIKLISLVQGLGFRGLGFRGLGFRGLVNAAARCGRRELPGTQLLPWRITYLALMSYLLHEFPLSKSDSLPVIHAVYAARRGTKDKPNRMFPTYYNPWYD